MSLAAYKAVMSFTGTQPGEISVKRLAIVLASFDPANVTDPKARVEVITFQKPRQEGCIPRSCLLALPEATSAHYVEQYLATLSDSEDGPPSASPVAAPTTPVAVTTSAAASSLAAAAATAPPAAVSAPAPAAVSPAPAPAESPAPAADPAEAMKHLFVALADDGTPTLKPTVAYLEAGGKVDLIPVVGGLYRHLPGPSLQRKAHPGDPDIIDPYHVLGAGAFGISFKMGDTRVGQRDVALKATAAPRTALARFMINNESYIPAAVRHPNLEPGGPLLRCLVTPFCEGGDLDQVIRRHQRNPSADPAADRTERWWLLVDMVRGLAYLHGRPFADNDRLVLHNDIKPANVLLRHDPATGRLVALLADLGMACEYTGGTVNLTPLIRGTPGFLAPELDPTAAARLADAGMRPGNTPATDVYAMGVTLYCLYSQTDTVHVTECPTEDDLRAAFAEVGARETIAGCRPALVELLVRMCSENPTARPAMGRILEAVEAVAGPMESVLLAAAREAHRLAEEARLKVAAEEEARRKAAAEAERLAALEGNLSADEHKALDAARSQEGAILDLSSRKFGDGFAVCLAAWLQTNRTVTQLYLNYNKIGDDGARAIAAALERNPTVRSTNRPKRHLVPSLPLATMLEPNTSLEQVCQPTSLDLIPSSLVIFSSACRLRQLDLGINNLGDGVMNIGQTELTTPPLVSTMGGCWCLQCVCSCGDSTACYPHCMTLVWRPLHALFEPAPVLLMLPAWPQRVSLRLRALPFAVAPPSAPLVPVRSNQPRSFSHSQQPLLAMQPGPLPAVQRLAPANPAGARRLTAPAFAPSPCPPPHSDLLLLFFLPVLLHPGPWVLIPQLDFAFNAIHDDGARALGAMLKQNKTLQEVWPEALAN
ncbi:hypothetical protein PAPYR_4607 [Paratrimastix pyriformis]|uniref:Protein kinase domain-containing protein n=1 Tax=Paratrimastix pyriformis TaxID=342808 RepID=A0ABQ8UNN0_9EUKA|nr:hypothetical protein PAPYR_4607 [Paratrimastix pyriformis]